ncbi:MAG: hypothetical protein M1829_002728 [Trizodia sp. TS-e1964]|nr:MAG: hypothetical protein M1829_002728 [Trizodia sp. TS-e1964]
MHFSTFILPALVFGLASAAPSHQYNSAVIQPDAQPLDNYNPSTVHKLHNGKITIATLPQVRAGSAARPVKLPGNDGLRDCRNSPVCISGTNQAQIKSLFIQLNSDTSSVKCTQDCLEDQNGAAMSINSPIASSGKTVFAPGCYCSRSWKWDATSQTDCDESMQVSIDETPKGCSYKG